ncbi:MAG: hypothetical protein SGJ27_22530 [Candidatus Melainabacteria bacterium]|nr:hypothetical protein [Candidatus Melainabacteria bacterium]
MASAIIPLLLAVCLVAFVAVMTALFLQFSKPGHRLIPLLLIGAGITFGALLFLVKLKAFAVVAVVAMVAVGFVVATTAPNTPAPRSTTPSRRPQPRPDEVSCDEE